MNSDRDYYENEAFWNPQAQVNAETRRIVFTVSMIPSDVQTIADIGCGNGLFLNYINTTENKKYARLLGVDMSNTALNYVGTEKIRANITNIPVNSASFDLVTSLEVIEHLNMDEYARGLRELARISKRYILISVPYNEKLENTLSECYMCKTKFNTDYHRRSFNSGTMIKLFDDAGFRNTSLCFFGDVKNLWILTDLYSLLKKVNPPPVKIALPCPSCGVLIEPAISSIDKSKHTLYKSITSVTKLLRPLWPKYYTKRWMFALYEKNI